MIKKVFFGILMTVVVFCAVPAGAAPEVQEGLWEITTEMKMGGMQMPAQKHTQCFTKEDLVPVDPKAAQNCTIKEKNVKGNVVTWTMECNSEGVKSVSTGSITYTGSSFSGNMNVEVSGMKMTNSMSGRRLGPCK